jgi:hypothetical protein
MPQLPVAVRVDRPAAVNVRVDQRRERDGTLENRIDREPDLTQHVEVRPEPGGDDDLVDRADRPVIASYPHLVSA